MSESKMVTRVENGKVLVLERVFDAPRELVFAMFKEAEHLKNWWGPRGWDLPVCNIDFRPGGVWHFCMKCTAPGEYFGMESWGKVVYKEIIEPEKLVYIDYFSDAEGNVNESMPATEATVLFIDLGGKTKIVSRAEYVSPEALKSVMDMGLVEGVTQTWDRLEERLAQVQGRS